MAGKPRGICRRPYLGCPIPSLGLVVALLLASSAEAQTIRGTVRDVETGTGVAAAEVTAHTDDGPVALAVSDSAGAFSLEVPGGGRYRLSVTRLGYAPLDSVYVGLSSREVLEVTLHFSTEPVALDPLTVTARGLALRHRATWQGFQHRYEERKPVGPTRLALREDPDFFPLMTVGDWLRDIRRTRRAVCTVVLVDGMPLPGWGDIAPALSTQMVEGVEYYHSQFDAPLEYRDGTSCAILAIWRSRDEVEVEGEGR